MTPAMLAYLAAFDAFLSATKSGDHGSLNDALVAKAAALEQLQKP